MQVTITINDILPDAIDTVKGETTDLLNEWMQGNDLTDYDTEDAVIDSIDYDGSLHTLVDGNCDIYRADEAALWYLHSDELEAAYADAGFGDERPDNYQIYCLYYYLAEVASKHLSELIEERKEQVNELMDAVTEEVKANQESYANLSSDDEGDNDSSYDDDYIESAVEQGINRFIRHLFTLSTAQVKSQIQASYRDYDVDILNESDTQLEAIYSLKELEYLLAMTIEGQGVGIWEALPGTPCLNTLV